LVGKLLKLRKEYGINPAGEGGVLETTVLNAPLFRKKLEVLDSEIQAKGNSGSLSLGRRVVVGITEGLVMNRL
jgi:diphthine-ammonia ligase